MLVQVIALPSCSYSYDFRTALANFLLINLISFTIFDFDFKKIWKHWSPIYILWKTLILNGDLFSYNDDDDDDIDKDDDSKYLNKTYYNKDYHNKDNLNYDYKIKLFWPVQHLL